MKGPEPLLEIFTIPNTEFSVEIRGLVRSAGRVAVYSEIDDMVNLHELSIGGEKIIVTEDDVVAACWAAACVAAPQLTAFEWLTFGASNPDLLAAIGTRCLVCSRLIAEDQGSDGAASAETEFLEGRDPLDFSHFGSVSAGSGGSPVSSTRQGDEPESDTTRLIIA
jgi:hypothetical protein